MPDYRLHYAVKDARAFADALTTVGRNLFSDVLVTPLFDEAVTKQGLDDAVRQVAGDVRPGDDFVLFVAGHGRALSGKYFFLQQDLDFSRHQQVATDAIGEASWLAWLASIHTQNTLLIFDTCESSAAAGLVRGDMRERQTAMEQLQHATGSNLIAAARQAAYEGYRGHGVLTFAVLEAFQKGPDGDANTLVDVDGLASHVDKRVPEITEDLYGVRQQPTRRLFGDNFPLGFTVLDPIAISECSERPDFIVVHREPLQATPDERAPHGRQLEPGFQVGAEFNGKWARVCRNGTKIGYVHSNALARIQ
jgi:uncharacterized caspase-like protein